MTKHLAGLLALAATLSPPALAQASYERRPEVQAFIRDLSARHGFVEKELSALFSKVKRADPILDAIKPPPPKSRSWEEYRASFVNEKRIGAGAEFWRTHRAALERAQREYGVQPEYILGIIGVETFYGRNMGRYRVLDALSTLAFDYPARSDFFRSELENYLLLARERSLDAYSVRGSYAGAIGIPQFMPSSTRRYAVDFDGDGVIDLRGNPADAIGSVANFLKQHGWQAGAEVMLAARPEGDAWRKYADGGVEPKYPLGELKRAGVAFDEVAHDDPRLAALVELEVPEKPSEYRVGFRNFYVLTRYNRSAFYAAVVAELAQALRKDQEEKVRALAPNPSPSPAPAPAQAPQVPDPAAGR